MLEMVFDRCIDFSEKDLLNRLYKYMDAKLNVNLEYPYINKFFRTVLKERPPCALGFIKSTKEASFSYIQNFFRRY